MQSPEQGDSAGGCAPLLRERNRYFEGQLLSARDFSTEQDYFIGRHRRHNRLLHGWGVVCGLKVRADPEHMQRGVMVGPGVALDCCGREIIVDEPMSVRLPDPPENGEGAPIGATTERYVLCVAHREEAAEPAPLPSQRTGERERREASRIRETAMLEVLSIEDLAPRCWSSSGRDSSRGAGSAEEWPDRAGACIEPDCVCGLRVPIALVTVQLDRTLDIDTKGRRQLSSNGEPGGDPPRNRIAAEAGPKAPSRWVTASLVVLSLFVLVVAELLVGADPSLRVAVGVVWLVGFVGLLAWRRRTVSRGLGSIGQALVVGVVLAILGLSLDMFADDRAADRQRAQRENEIRLLISTQQPFSFRGESLEELDLSFLEMSTTESAYDFSFADLVGSNLEGVVLRNAILRGADLRFANLTGADLTGADLRDADLAGALFDATLLVAANLAGAHADFALEGVVLGASTICPDGGPPGYVRDFREQLGSAGFRCSRADAAGEAEFARTSVVVPVDAQPGTLVARVRATQEASHQLIAVRPGPALFAVDASGDITVARPLQPGTYVLLVESRNGDDSTQVEVSVSVELPQSLGAGPRLILVVPQAASIGSAIGDVQAPPDFPSERRFQLLAQPPENIFDVDESTGRISLIGRGQPGTTYAIVVEISDLRSGFVSHAEVSIEVVE